jgi:predicted nucleotidyltransferase
MDIDTSLVDELRRAHGVHTVLLYGSRARGDSNPASDVDVAGYADVAATARDVRSWRGMYLDAFVYPTALAESPDAEMLKLLGSRVLLDERGIARPLLDKIATLERRGPPPLSESERRLRRLWARKMLGRIRRGDVEAHYRHHWLLYQILEDYYALRGVWYRGPKEAFADLRKSSPEVLAAFERALAPGASVETLEPLVGFVEAGE